MSTAWTPSGEIVQQRINHEWTRIGTNVFARTARLGVRRLDAAFLSTNEPGYAR